MQSGLAVSGEWKACGTAWDLPVRQILVATFLFVHSHRATKDRAVLLWNRTPVTLIYDLMLVASCYTCQVASTGVRRGCQVMLTTCLAQVYNGVAICRAAKASQTGQLCIHLSGP